MGRLNAEGDGPPTVSAQAALDLADAALGAAGHAVTDPVVRRIWVQVAAGEISGDEGAEKILNLYRAGHFDT